MKKKNFNAAVSFAVLILGAVFVIGSSPSIDANVIGPSNNSIGLSAIIGLVMIISSIGLFIMSMHSTDLDLERLVRRTKNHEEISHTQESDTEKYNGLVHESDNSGKL